MTDTEDFDSLTGIHVLTIDTNNDTGDSGFWVTGADYSVVLVGAVIDGQTVNAPLCHFSIENRNFEVSGITSTAANKIADIICRRAFQEVEDSSNGDALDQHSIIGACSKLNSKVLTDANGRNITTFRANEKTPFYVQSIHSDPAADNITGVG